jgi:hypothetical protein
VSLLNAMNSIGRRPVDIVEVDGQSSVFSTGQRREKNAVDAHCAPAARQDAGCFRKAAVHAL